jgi:phosphatidylserine decarboxylase
MTRREQLQGWMDRLFVAFHSLLPSHFLSWLMFHVTRISAPWFKNAFIRAFCRIYRIDLEEAEFGLAHSYRDFNHFFTRALKPGARPLDPDPHALVSPVDGAVSQLGPIREGTMIQAKGFDYAVSELLGGSKTAALFQKGAFCTLYLAPFNYHRIHMPTNGKLREWGYVPGRLFSVSTQAVRTIPRVFTRNERVYAVFETDHGPLAMVLVGALFVGSIETVWNGRITPPHGQPAGAYTPMSPVVLLRGREMGRFNMGSTVILLAPPGMVGWRPQLGPQVPVRVGQALGTLAKVR